MALECAETSACGVVGSIRRYHKAIQYNENPVKSNQNVVRFNQNVGQIHEIQK
jgi:hypothetical protein